MHCRRTVAMGYTVLWQWGILYCGNGVYCTAAVACLTATGSLDIPLSALVGAEEDYFQLRPASTHTMSSSVSIFASFCVGITMVLTDEGLVRVGTDATRSRVTSVGQSLRAVITRRCLARLRP